MFRKLSRRDLLAAGAGLALGEAAVLAASSGPAAAAQTTRGLPVVSGPGRGVEEESRSLDELYEAAVAEGGKLVLYQGGDVDSQAAAVRTGWAAAFPEVSLTVVVDYSKYHDARVDNQLATRTLVPDVVQLQTLHDFPRWKRQRELLLYKPAGFSEVHEGFKDRDGAWTALMVLGFSFLYDVHAVAGHAPRNPGDLVDPRWKNAIASSYPHYDDAVLFLYHLYQRAYGWDWTAAFAGQSPHFARGTHTPAAAVTSGQKAIGVGGGGIPLSTSTATRWVMPDRAPFMAWGQRAAILKRAPHPAAAKLYMNWQLSEARQKASFNGWSVREDVVPNPALKPVWDIPNAHVEDFPRFMENRSAIERLKQTFALYFGEVDGAPSPGWPGLHPGR